MRADLVERLESLARDSESTEDAETGADCTFLNVECGDFDNLILEAALALRALRDAPVGWLPIESAPEGTAVLLAVEYSSGRRRVIRAMRAAQKTLTLGDEQDSWEGCYYDEDSGETYCSPGWYEQNEYEETYWHVHDKAVAWQPLPEPPK